MPFPALSAMLPVYSDLLHWWLRAWVNLTPTRASSKQPSALPHFVSLAINLQLLWLLWMLPVIQAMIWCCFTQPRLSHSSRRTQLCTVPCVPCPTIIIIPITSHGARCLHLGKGFTSPGEINPKQVNKFKSKCLQVSIQVKAPVTAGADVFCYQAAGTSEQLRS